MGGKTLIALWISVWTVAGLEGKHNDNAKVRQYRNVPQEVYASVYANAAPYGSFSFHSPSTVSTEATIPVDKQEDSQNELKDSYGNTIHLPQAYTFPQEFFPFPKLTAAPSYHFPQGLPTPWQWASSTPLTQFGPFAPSFVYAGAKNPTQPLDWSQFDTTQDSSKWDWNQFETTNAENSNNKLAYAAQGFNWLRNEPKFQWLDDKPRYQEYYEPRYRTPHSLKEKLQTPIQHTVKTNYNGQNVIVQLETKPPLPLVDLRLLEPLKTDVNNV